MLGVSEKWSLIIAMVGQINKFVEWGHDWFLVHWIVIYPMDSAIQHLNNRAQKMSCYFKKPYYLLVF